MVVRVRPRKRIHLSRTFVRRSRFLLVLSGMAALTNTALAESVNATGPQRQPLKEEEQGADSKQGTDGPNPGSTGYERFQRLISQLKAVHPTPRKFGWRVEAGGGLEYSSNAYAFSNLGLGIRLPAKSDEIANVWGAGSAYYNVTPKDRLTASVTVGRQFYLNQPRIDANFANVSVHFDTLRLNPLEVGLGYSCDREFDGGLIYRTCGPDARVRNVTRHPAKFHLELEASAFKRNGRNIFFEDFYGGKASVLFAGGHDLKYYAGIQYLYRRFEGGYGKVLALPDRQDHRITIPFGLEHRLGRHLVLSLEATGSLNWSNYDEYRYWDVSVGPHLRFEVFK